MTDRMRLHFAIQILAMMVGVAGACVAVMVDAMFAVEPAAMVQATAESQELPEAEVLDGCERGYSSARSLVEADLDQLWWSREQALARCHASLGEDASACEPGAIMPLEQAVCLVEAQIGEGEVQRVELRFDAVRGQIHWLLGSSRRAFRIMPS
ncbi:hypothetical protein G6O69_00795 [Pseudenhygromyxa sp. WMMC2535]|uniref:hypothetical protein n=1 Tax=Pseudenhygromyxa sp. WMMC2535 TaxID=2712867 RepID=UPI001552E78E|nr:hypothetical protein [Pseudenhygromyxa sp. WMMC2535]NVB36347.1 hypothetical protein [Pseudenhygromyxa sp. WMMC2535]